MRKMMFVYKRVDIGLEMNYTPTIYRVLFSVCVCVCVYVCGLEYCIHIHVISDNWLGCCTWGRTVASSNTSGHSTWIRDTISLQDSQ